LPLVNPSEALRLFIEKYGEKALFILRAMYELSQDPTIDHRLGDFSYKHLVLKLGSMGLVYNPINMLRLLEKELGIIEKSYVSSNQTWWRIVDLEAVRSVLGEYFGVEVEDPRVKALLIKYRSLEPRSILESLRRMALKENLSRHEREEFKKFVFNTLDKIIELLSEMENYEEVFTAEITVLKEILGLADIVSSKIDKPRSRIIMKKTGETLDADTRINTVENPTSTERDYSA